MEDLDTFNRKLDEQGNLESINVSMNPGHMVVIDHTDS